MLKTMQRFFLAGKIILLAALVAALVWVWFQLRSGMSGKEKVAATLTVLKSEPMRFLVTRKLASSVVIEKKDNSALWGDRFGLLIAEVEIFYGFDFARISEKEIVVTPDGVTVDAGEPRMLTCSVRLDSMRYFTKMSGLNYLRDKVTGADLEAELREEFTGYAEQYFAERNLLPDRRTMLDEVNGLLSKTQGGFRMILK